MGGETFGGADLAKGLKGVRGAELARLFDVRNVNLGKLKADVEVGLDGGALPAADGNRAALWLWSRNTVEAGTTRPETRNEPNIVL